LRRVLNDGLITVLRVISGLGLFIGGVEAGLSPFGQE